MPSGHAVFSGLEILKNAWWLPNVLWIENHRKCLAVTNRFLD
jgi:hypothetical protein